LLNSSRRNSPSREHEAVICDPYVSSRATVSSSATMSPISDHVVADDRHVVPRPLERQ